LTIEIAKFALWNNLFEGGFQLINLSFFGLQLLLQIMDFGLQIKDYIFVIIIWSVDETGDS